jgi:hypothetical protein
MGIHLESGREMEESIRKHLVQALSLHSVVYIRTKIQIPTLPTGQPLASYIYRDTNRSVSATSVPAFIRH